MNKSIRPDRVRPRSVSLWAGGNPGGKRLARNALRLDDDGRWMGPDSIVRSIRPPPPRRLRLPARGGRFHHSFIALLPAKTWIGGGSTTFRLWVMIEARQARQVLVVLSVSRTLAMRRAILRLLAGAMISVVLAHAYGGLHFRPTATSNRLTDYAIVLALVPAAALAILLLAAWLR